MLPDFRVRQRDFLLEISRAITAQLDLGEVLRRVLNASVVMLGGQSGLIALRAPDELFYIRAVSGVDNEKVDALNQHLHELFDSADASVDNKALNARLRVMMTEIDPKLRQSIALPLIFAGEPLGLLIIFRNYQSGANANDLQILQSFADQAAIAVNNAQLYERIIHERRRLEAIQNHSADGILILNADLEVMRMNHALERMTGWYMDDAIGKQQDEVIVWHKREQGDLNEALANGWPPTTPESTLYVEGDIIRPDGITLSVGITYAPMLTSDGQLESIIANVRDITNFRKAQEMQNTFISVISHELKTPVAIIKGYAATLRRPDAQWNRDIIVDNLGVIEEEADRLNTLIQDLLTASKIQAQRELTLDIGEVWLDDLVTRSVERVSNQIQNHTFVIDFPSDFPAIMADEARLRQVLDNLLSNAIKYSPDGGDIYIVGDYDDHAVTVCIKDSGVGITQTDQQRVFDRFFRVDGKLSRKTQGTGLGLYLAKTIIDAHDGHIGVDSTIGAGSNFYFTIPR